MQNHPNHNKTSELYFDLHLTKDKQTGYYLSICIKNNNNDNNNNNNNNNNIIIIVII